MNVSIETSETSDVPWQSFQDRNEGHRFLKLDPLYSMTEELVSALGKAIPHFFSEEDKAFETDLALHRECGFLHGYPIGEKVTLVRRERPEDDLKIASQLGKKSKDSAESYRLLLERLEPGETREMADVFNRRTPVLEKRLSPLLRTNGRTNQSIRDGSIIVIPVGRRPGPLDGRRERASVQQKQEIADTLETHEAYAMWLILNTDFQYDLRSLRSKWHYSILQAKRFPRHPGFKRSDSERADDQLTPKCREEFSSFYRHWGIDRLLTWEIPLPLDGFDVFIDEAERSKSSTSGVNIFLPWHLLRSSPASLSSILFRSKVEHSPDHLYSWLFKEENRGGRGNSDISWQQKFWIYRSLFLVLRTRHLTATRRNTSKIDEVMASLIGRSVDIIKRQRQSLKKALKKLELV